MTGETDPIQAVRNRLDGNVVGPLPRKGRVSATLALLCPSEGGDVTLTITRRQPFLSSHPGQLSFPGGHLEPGETAVDAALRETTEEIGLGRAHIDVLGMLPPFYVGASETWMIPVVGKWNGAEPLVANSDEVAEIMPVSFKNDLSNEAVWRAVPVSGVGVMWAWSLRPNRLLWGATGYVTSVLLDAATPGWNRGVNPEDLPVSRQVVPWKHPVESEMADDSFPWGRRSRDRE